MTLRERLAAAASGEGSVIFTLGFIIGFPHYLYADLGWQLAEGRMLWAGTFPSRLPEAFDAVRWIDHEWLFELLAWPWWAHGLWPLAAALCTALVAVVPLVAVAIARRYGASPYGANAAGYLTIASTVTSYAPRPQTGAEICFALLLFVLLGQLRRPWIVLPLTIVWANLHGSVVLAPVLVALVAVGRAIETGRLARPYAIAFACALAGTLLTPAGIGTWTEAAAFAARGELLAISEWQPVSLAYPVELFVLVVYGAVLIAGGVPVVRRSAVALVLLASFGLLWLLHVRFLPFFGIAAAPALAIAVGRTRLGQRRRRMPHGERHAGWLAVPLLAAIALTSVLRAPQSLAVEAEPAATVALVEGAHVRGRLFAPFTAGGYLELRGDPVQVLLDTHALPFGPDVWRDYETIDAARRGWHEALDRRAFGAVVAAGDGPLATALATTPGWYAAAHTNGYVLFVRKARNLRRAER
jgi:hypothetical protein